MNLQIAYLAECEVTLVAFLQLFSTAHFITSVFALKQHDLALNTNTGPEKVTRTTSKPATDSFLRKVRTSVMRFLAGFKQARCMMHGGHLRCVRGVLSREMRLLRTDMHGLDD